jgi:hypothetical protein
MSSVTQANPVRVYVAHLWAEDDDYLRVFEYLESADKFYYANRSAPDRLPEGDKEAVRQEYRRQIAEAEVVVVPSALHRRNAELVDFQVNCAKAFDKPVLAMEPFGGRETLPPSVQGLADEIVLWDQRQLVDAIKRQARHEETTRFDTIEFTLD